MANSNYIIWFGSVFEEKMMLDSIAISPAANKWQLNIIFALINSGYKVVNIGHRPERVYPFGKFFVSKKRVEVPEKIRLVSSSYINVPFLRIIELNILATIKIVRLFFELREKPIYMVSYNTYSYNLIPILFSRFIMRIKWITLVADPMYESSGIINPFNFLADSKVFLSYKLFTESRTKNKFHFDGGISRTIELNNEIFSNKEKIVLYTGAIARYAGIELLVKAFSLTKSKNLRLVICGKGSNELLNQYLQDNSRISYLGVVDEQKLEDLYAKAYLFINPRLISEPTNNSNFPSKLLDYLSYCKPVISTYSGGISPSYKEIIQFVYNDDPQGMADKIDEIISWDNLQYKLVSGKISNFVEEHKKWSNLIVEFNKWVHHL